MNLRALLPILVLILVPSLEAAEKDSLGLRVRGFGVNLAVVDNESQVIAGHARIGAHLDLGMISPSVGLLGVIQRLSGSRKERVSFNPTRTEELTASEWGLSGQVRLFFNPEATWRAYGLGGLGIYRATVQDDSQNSLGVTIGVGMNHQLGQTVALSAELGYKEALSDRGFDLGHIEVGVTIYP